MNNEIRSRGEKIFDAFNVVLMFVLMFIFIYPFWDTLILSVSDASEANRMGFRFLPKWPLNFDAYQKVFAQKEFLTAALNSVWRTVIGTVCTTGFTFMGAFVLAKKTLPGRKAITIFITVTMFFGGGLVPTYLLMQNLGLHGSRWAWILPGLTSAWYLFIARNFLMGVSETIEEAARIDGANTFQVMGRIVFPMSKPVLAVIALWTAVGQWNSWYDAQLYTNKEELMVLQLLLRRILINNDPGILAGALTSSTAVTTPETVKAATIIVTILPIVLTYPFFQKYFVKGVNIGSVKG